MPNLEQYAATRKPIPSYVPSTPFYLLKDASSDQIIPGVDTADVLTLGPFSLWFLKLDIREASSVTEIIKILNQAIERLLTANDQEIFSLHGAFEEMQFLTSDDFLDRDPCGGCPGALGFNEQAIVDSACEIDPADEKISASSSTTSDPDSLRKTFLQKWRTILEWLEE